MMIKGLWDKIKLVCGNHPDSDNMVMEIRKGAFSPFYACPKYTQNIYNGGDYCLNRITLVDYEKMISHIAEEVNDMIENDEVPNLQNLKWTRNGVEFKILVYTNNEIVVSVLNKTALKGLKTHF